MVVPSKAPQIGVSDVGRVSLLFRAVIEMQDMPLTDEEYAFQLQTDFLKGLMDGVNNLRFAKSLGGAIDSDINLVERIHLEEQAAVDDHQYAAALSHDRPLPEKSLAQRTVEDAPLIDFYT